MSNVRIFVNTLWIIIVFFSVVTPWQLSLKAVTIGSDTAPSRIAAQQALGNGDRIAGFAALEGGASLTSVVATVTWDSFFPLSGAIQINGGGLLLNTNLFIADQSEVQTFGDITGQGRMLELSSTVTFLPTSGASLPSGVNAVGLNEVTRTSQSSDILATAWSYDSQFLAVGNASIGGANQLFLYSFDGVTLTQESAISLGAQVNDVSWHPTEHKLAVGTNSNGSTELRIYSINPVTPNLSTLLSSYNYGTSNITAVAYHPSGNYLAVGGSQAFNQLGVFPLNGDGTLGTPVFVNTGITVATEGLSWNAAGNQLAVALPGGLGAQADVYTFNAGGPSLTANASVNFGFLSTIAAVCWSTVDSQLLSVGIGTAPTFRLYRHNAGAGTLTQITTIAAGSTVNSISWDTTGGYMTFCQATGNVLALYSFNFTTSTFSSIQNITGIGAGSTVEFSPSDQYVSFGGTSDTVIIYELVPAIRCYTISNLNIVLNNDLALNNCCLTFVGNCGISGDGLSTLDLQNSSTIYIANNSRLTMNDIIIRGISTNSFSLMGPSSRLILQNSDFCLSDNYQFLNGGFDVMGECIISGPGKFFTYATDQVSTVSAYGSLILDAGMTFSYAPSSGTRSNLIFENNQAQMILNSATFSTSTTGIIFKKGTIGVDGKSFFVLGNSAKAGSIALGDSLTAANNSVLHIYPGATLVVTNGFLENDNV